MKRQDRFTNQGRWNQYGTQRQKELKRNPEGYVIADCPFRQREFYAELVGLMSPIAGKQILELGGGWGDVSVWLARQGARITAIDIGADLVAAATDLARLNQVDCEFRQGTATTFPFVESNTYDLVIGTAILHHLSEADVLKALQECARVLKTGGVAIFWEPVENSKLFNLIQNLFPIGKKGSDYYRPSILRQKAWRKYVEALDDRAMTNRELIFAGEQLFSTVRISPYSFLVRLTRLVGETHRKKLLALDEFLFKVFPPLKYLSQTVLVEYRK